MKPSIPSSNTPLLGVDGTMSAPWYRFFADKERKADAAAAGEVVGTDGISGGGPVSQGVTLSLTPGGVSNAAIRPALANSVIGRGQNSVGTVADIPAQANGRFLARFADILDFYDFKLASYTVATVPDPVVRGAGAMIFVSNETGGPVPAYSDGANWRRVTDGMVIA